MLNKTITKIFFRNKKNENREKSVNAFIISTKRLFKDLLFIIAGVSCAAIGLKGFLLPNNFIDGGAAGISLLIAELTGFSFSVLIVVINFPFIILSLKVLNKSFAIKTGLAILALALAVFLFQIPYITNDKLLISIFGGFFLGAGIGLAIRGGSVIDGTEVLAIFLSRKYGISIGDVIMIINIIIFSFAAYLMSLETAMYAMLTYLSASKTVDFIVEGIEEYYGVTIISENFDEIQSMLKYKMKRGYTIYLQKKGSGKKGDLTEEKEILYTVITRLEIGKLYTEIEKIDADAFIVTQSVKDIKGGMIKRRPLHE